MGLIDVDPDKYLPRNPTHGSLRIIDILHQHNYDGYMYAFHCWNLAPASGVTSYIQIDTPAANGCAVFMTLNVIAGNYETLYQEGATISTAGTAIQIDNLNRRSSHVTTIKAYQASTVLTAGSVFGTRVTLCAATNQNKGISTATLVDRLLKPNTTYVFGIKPLAASTQWSRDCVIVDIGGV